ncbi:MAG: hypothetical protein AABY22_00740 [Nanoarchaeota archaeon]|mgnify:CR=1 FL=1
MIHKKKGQEEMVGFVLIVVIVAVIMLIFLGINLNKPKTESGKQSEEVNSFLNALSEYTTSCALNYEPNYANVRNLVQYCAIEETCLNGENSCQLLEKELRKMLELSWQISPDSRVNGYELKIESINLNIFEGNKSSSYVGDVLGLPNNIQIDLKVYY